MSPWTPLPLVWSFPRSKPLQGITAANHFTSQLQTSLEHALLFVIQFSRPLFGIGKELLKPFCLRPGLDDFEQFFTAILFRLNALALCLLSAPDYLLGLPFLPFDFSLAFAFLNKMGNGGSFPLQFLYDC